MVDNNYTYRQYIHIAEAFSSGKTEEGNEMLRRLNLLLAIAKVSSDAFFPVAKACNMLDKKYHVMK